MLDGDDCPGVGDYGEEADGQGELEEGGVKHLMGQKNTFWWKIINFQGFGKCWVKFGSDNWPT